MSADEFGKNQGESDIEQLTRIVDKLEKAFQELTQTTDRFNKTVMSDMMKAAMAFMKKEKDAQNQRFKAEKDHLDKIQQMNTKSTLSMNKVMTQLSNSLTIANDRLNASNIRSNKAIQLSAQESLQRQLLKTLTHKQAMESEEQHKLSVQSNIKLRHSLSGNTTTLSLFTGLLRNGISAGLLFNKGINLGSTALQRQKDLIDLNNTLTSKENELIKAKAVVNPNQSQQDDIKSLEKTIIDLKSTISATKTGQGAGTAGVLGSKGMGFLSVMAEFATKHKTGIFLGALAAGTLLMVLKKAFDASPMFQQMMKLLNFGIMLVLRPIGDFFGFILRPILIQLFRKFIIPFYQNVYPFFQKWGNKIGEALGSEGGFLALIAIAIGSIAAAWKITTLTLDAIKNALLPKKEKPLTSEGDKSKNTKDTTSKQPATDEKNKTKDSKLQGNQGQAKDIYGRTPEEAAKTSTKGGTQRIGGSYARMDKSTKGGGYFRGITSTTTKGGEFMGRGSPTIKTDAEKALEKIRSAEHKAAKSGNTSKLANLAKIKKALINITRGMTGGALGIAQGTFIGLLLESGIDLGIDLWKAANGLPIDKKQEYDPKHPFGTTAMAKGGIITEPISGVGKSGRQYLFGENGAERITPLNGGSGGGSSIVINIQNFTASQNDLNALRKTILNVIQTSNVGRGKV